MQKTDLQRFSADTEKLWGIYRGVVEDRYDPLRLGRIRVRVMGVHTEEQVGDLNRVPWEEIVWAEPILSPFGGSISDVGGWYIPLQGSHVMVFFENGNFMQPRYFGSVPGFPVDGAKYSQLEKQDGYRDPDIEYPLDDHIEEHDWHRLARRMRLGDTYLAIKEANLDDHVPTAYGGEWNEQPPMYETEYPHGNVWATEEEFDKNQVFELDGTPGAQRMQYWHPSMSYFEINKEGRMVIRNTLHRWDICDGIVHQHFMVNRFETIDDTLIFLIQNDEFREIKGARWTLIHETDWKDVEGTNYTWIKEDNIEYVENNKHSTILADMLEFIGGRRGITVGEDLIIYAGTAIAIGADNTLDICSPQISIGETGTTTYIGETVNIGPIVNLGVDAAVATCVQPEEPDPPIEPPEPPGPDEPPDYIPPDDEIEMPIPGCP